MRWRGRLLAALLLLAAAQPAQASPQAEFDRALAFDAAGDQQRAFALYLRAARGGLAEAQFNVAVLYDIGRGIPRDASRAALFYAFAAVNGNARAAYNLGLLFETGDGVGRSAYMAKAWYRKAAAEGLVAGGEKLRLLGETQAAPPARRGALPAFPGRGAQLGGDGAYVPFVWLPPAGNAASIYYVQIVRLQGGGLREVLTQLVDVSATRAPIGRAPGDYAWRVFTCSPATASYSASSWVRFAIGAAGK